MIKTVSDISQIDIAGDIREDIDMSLSEDNLQDVEREALERLDDIKDLETHQGRSPAEGGRWNNIYNRQYANREKGGRRSPVTLRNRTQSIEETRIQESNKGSELRFRNRRKGEIFFYHDSGTAKGGKYRQIYPDSDRQMPDEVTTLVDNHIFDLLS